MQGWLPPSILARKNVPGYTNAPLTRAMAAPTIGEVYRCLSGKSAMQILSGAA